MNTKLRPGSILNEDKFAQGDKTARRQFCTKGKFRHNTIFNIRSFLKECKKNSKNIYIEKTKKINIK